MKLKPKIVTSILAGALLSCCVSAAQSPTFLVPKDAVEIVAREAGQQVDFKVRRPLAEAPIPEKALAEARSAGWQYCTADQWDTFSDDASRRVMQRVSYLRKPMQVIGVVERYLQLPARDSIDMRAVTLVSRTLSESEIESIVMSNRLRCR